MSVLPPAYPTNDISLSSTSLTPYLQLSHLLSLTWLAYPILSLIFIAFRLQLSLDSAQDAVATAKDNLLTSCKAAERAATSAASMPRYLAIASNEQFADAVNGTLNAARAALILSLTVMEAVINFIIDLYRSTLLCFLELVVRGGLAILISAVQEVNTLIQSATTSLRTSIQSDIASANNVIKSAVDGINKINPFSDITVPQINVPSLDALQNVQLPSTIEDALTNLNSSLPSVAALKDELESIINTPFELVKKDINDTFAGISFNSSVLPIPELNTLSFCSDLDTSVVDDVGRDLIKTAKIGVIIVIAAALLLIALNCLLTWYKWRCMKAHLEYTRQAWMTDPTMYHVSTPAGSPQIILNNHNLMMLNANSEHPLVTRISNQISARLRLTPSQHSRAQWLMNYIFHPPAAACLLIGLIGLLSVEIQLLAMGPLVHKYQERSAAAATDFSNTIASSINASMYNQSAAYAQDVNGRVDSIQTQINDGLFGWVNGTTVTINTTINNFYEDVEKAVAQVFNGTILESPANEFIRCFIGSKVDAIENALTFLHDNLRVDMPRVNDSVLVLSPDSVREATAPIAAAAIGGSNPNNSTDPGNDGLLVRLVNSYAESLKKERVMFGAFIALWGLVLLMGICILLWDVYGTPWLEKKRRRRWEEEQRAGNARIIVPFRDEKYGVARDLPSFSPMPSPRPPFLSSRSASPSHNSSALAEKVDIQAAESGNAKPWVNIASKPVTFFAAFGKGVKGLRKEKKPDDLSSESKQDLSNTDAPYQNSDIAHSSSDISLRNTTWLNRVLGNNGSTENMAGRGRPKLEVFIERPSLDTNPAVPPSRWSVSPDPTQTTNTWMNLIVPSKKANSGNPAPSHPPIAVPIIAPYAKPQAQHVPSDVDDETFVTHPPLVPSRHVPTPLALPLHHGFVSPTHNDSFTTAPSVPSSTKPPRPPRAHQRQPSGIPSRASPPPPPTSPRMVVPQYPLAPPPDRHRRVSTLPNSQVIQLEPTRREVDNSATSITPVTRLLTSTHARQSSSVNPFSTPFDDEYVFNVPNAHPPVPEQQNNGPINPFTALAF